MKITAAIAAAMLIIAPLSGINAAAYSDPVTLQEIPIPSYDSGFTGVKLVDGRMYRIENGTAVPYSGFAKVTGGTKYYISGSQWFGWLKSSGKWYYFDGDNQGFMATDKARTGAGTYYFGEDGAWSGRLSAKAKVPEDFSFKWKELSYGAFLSIDSATGVLSNGESGHDNLAENFFDRNVNISEKDKQIIYDCLISCGADTLAGELTGSAIDENYTANTDTVTYEMSFTANGSAHTVTGDSSMYGYYDSSSDVRHMAYLNAFFCNYISEFPEYEETEHAKLEALHGVDPAVTVTRKIDNVNIRLFQYDGGDSSEYSENETNVLITSADEAKLYTDVFLEKSYGSDSGIVRRIRSYEDDFFNDHVLVIYTDFVNSSSYKYKPEGSYKVSGAENKIVVRVERRITDELSDSNDMARFVILAEIPREYFDGANQAVIEIEDRK